MDSIEILNSEFHGTFGTKTIDNSKVSRFLISKGYKPYGTEGPATNEAMEAWLYDNNYAYTSDVWFEELKYNTPQADNDCDTLFAVIAKELGCQYQSVQSFYIGDYDGVTVDSGITPTIQVHDDEQLDYVIWWCKNFSIEYEVDGYEVSLYDFASENEMCFCFLYDKEGKLIESCALDWSSGTDAEANDIGYALANMDTENIFSSYDTCREARKIIDYCMDKISKTKEVVF